MMVEQSLLHITRKNLTRKACASVIVALATVIVVTSCGRRQPAYTDASPPKLQRACQAVDEATGLEMTEADRAWCRSMMQAWYSDTSYTRPDPADQFTGISQLRYLQAKALDCRSTADAYKLTGSDRWEAVMRCLVIVRGRQTEYRSRVLRPAG